MTITVDLPDGSTADFPDETPEAEITQALDNHLAPKAEDIQAAQNATGSEMPGLSKVPTAQDITELKQSAYGNDLPGAIAAGTGHFIGDVPILGHYLKEGAERAAAGVHSLQYGTPFQEELGRVKSAVEKADTEHPVAATTGGIAGNVTAAAALPVSALGLAPEASIATNTARAGLTGATVEGADAALQGKSPKEIAQQSGVGAVMMGATPVVGKAVGALVGKLMDKAAQFSGPLSNEDQRAVEWAVTSLKRDRGMSDADIDKRFDELGPHAFLAEFGPNTSGAANAVNALPGEGQTIVSDAISARKAAARGRLEDAVTEAMGPRVNVHNLTEQGIMDRSDASRDLYDQFRSMQVHPTQPVKNLIAGNGEGLQRVPGLEELGLLDEARQMAQIESAATGRPTAPMQNFFTTGDRKTWPTTQSFNYIKQAIDKRIDGSYNDLGEPTQLTRFYTQMKKRLDDTLAQANPDAAAVWKQAREAWGNPTEIMRARNEGQKAFQRGTRRDEMLAQLSDYSGPERAAYKQGARDSIAEDMDATMNGDTTARNRLLAPANQEKLNYLATNKNYNSQTLVDKLEQEKSMADFGNFVKGNSKTAGTQAAQEMLTPNPNETLVARAREAYSPHVMPGAFLIPKAAENAAARAQEQSFENSRTALAPWLMKQGPEAAAFAKALLAHEAATTPSTQIGPAAQRITQMLAAGLVPRTAPTIAGYLPQ